VLGPSDVAGPGEKVGDQICVAFDVLGCQAVLGVCNQRRQFSGAELEGIVAEGAVIDSAGPEQPSDRGCVSDCSVKVSHINQTFTTIPRNSRKLFAVHCP
jgi:hypothetical protein